MEDSSAQWPHVFESLQSRLSENGPCVTLAESWEEQKELGLCARTLTCGLVREEDYEAITGEQELGHEVDTSGPYPNPDIEEYIPRFWIFGTSAIPDGIEPLVLSWTSNNQTVQQPDPGMLMTYGLIPRVEQGGTVHWDEPAKPTPDVLIVKPVSICEHSHETLSSVTIQREYLQDYASLRKRAVVTVFYERWIVDNDDEARSLLEGDRYREFRYRDACFRVQLIEGEDSKFHIDIWGHRLILRPGPLPVSEDANRFGKLDWPGVSESIDDKNWRGQGMTYVYVKDEVLGRFEGRPEYQIYPESGSVEYGGQWAVSHCGRIGRDLIRLKVKKLYEGNSPNIVRHYYQHAVEPPAGAIEELRQARNIGVRARNIVYGLVGLGEAVAELATPQLAPEITSNDVVSLDRQWLDHHGWWKADAVEPICRHVPISATRDAFLNRCKDLYRLIVEGFQEKVLRKVLIDLGLDESEIKEFRSLKLLCRLVELGLLAQDAGLKLITDRAEVIRRFESPADPSPCLHLFALNDLRQLDVHRQGSSFEARLTSGLGVFDIDPASTAAGYGEAIDALYDRLTIELHECAEALATA